MRRTTVLLAACVALCGCDSDELRVELVPKRGVAFQPPASGGHGHDHGASVKRLQWTLPAGWTQAPPEPGSMRFATLRAGEGQDAIEVGVFRFPGEAGGLLANVNRWRAELALPEVDEAGLPRVVTQVAGKSGTLTMDWLSPDQARGLLGAMVTLPSETWFFKAAGPAPPLATRRADFGSLIQSLRLSSSGHSHDDGHEHSADDGHDHGAPPPAQPATLRLPSWRVPASWTVEAVKPPRLASFAVGAGAACAVTRFPGRVGTALANLNRWRQQLGLPALDAEPTPEPRVVDGETGQWIDLRGASERMLICAVPHAGHTWFFKLRGPLRDVDDAEPEFAEFVDSIHWPAAAPVAPVPQAPTPDAPPPVAPPPAAVPGLSWELPAGWTQAAQPGRMRIATIHAGSTDLAITRFPGDVGGLLQNVNRWRLQIGLEPVLRVEDQPMTRVDVGKVASTRVDLDGPERSLRVVLIPRNGQTWFVKLVGSPSDVRAQEASFAEFVTSLNFTGGGK